MPIAAGVAPVVAVSDRGKATGGSLTTLVDASKNWPIDVWQGAAVNLFLGDALCAKRIISNTKNTMTFQAISTPIVAGIQYFIVSTNIIVDGANVVVSGTTEVAIAVQRVPLAITGVADVTIAAQSVGLSLKPVWAAEEDEDLNLTGEGPLGGDSGCNIISYPVLANTTLYVGLLSYGGELLRGYIELREGTTRRWGMNWWATFAFPIIMPFITPAKFVAGETCNVYLYNDDPDQKEARANLSCWLVPS